MAVSVVENAVMADDDRQIANQFFRISSNASSPDMSGSRNVENDGVGACCRTDSILAAVAAVTTSRPCRNADS